MNRYSPEQIEAAKNADLAEFVQRNGFKCEKAGRELHIRGYGGLYINPDKNMYVCFSDTGANGSPKGGKGVLSFVQNIMGYDFKSAMQLIVGDAAAVKSFEPPKKETITEHKELKLPEKHSDGYKAMYAYLINTRKLAPDIVKEFVKQGLIYPTAQEIKKGDKSFTKTNAVFLHMKDGKPCGADVTGIDVNPNFKFKKCITAGLDEDFGFVYDKGDKGKIDTVYFFEAPIDMISFIQLHPEIENAKFVSAGGVKPHIAEYYLNEGYKVVSCVDNDKAGQDFNNRILVGLMAESLGKNNAVFEEIKGKSIPFINTVLNGKECSCFLSKDHYKAAVSSEEDVKSNAVVWINRSNFSVNRECAEADVKDFNDLLKKKTSEAAAEKVVHKCSIAADTMKQLDKAIDNMKNRSQERGYIYG